MEGSAGSVFCDGSSSVINFLHTRISINQSPTSSAKIKCREAENGLDFNYFPYTHDDHPLMRNINNNAAAWYSS